jgi:glycosyltransferase involved in cell wall biosynthesis
MGIIAVDISRSLQRFPRAIGSGIDRVELEYVRHFATKPNGRLTCVRRNNVYILPRFLTQEILTAYTDAWSIGRFNWRASIFVYFTQLVIWYFTFFDLKQKWPANSVYFHVSHANLINPKPFERLAFEKVRLFFFIHDAIPITHPEFCREGEEEKHRLRLKTVFGLADAIIVNSDYTRKKISHIMIENDSRIEMIVSHLGANEQSASRDDLALKNGDPPIFLVIGTIEPRKNHALLLDIWEQFDAWPSCQRPVLYVVGRRGWRNSGVFARLDAMKDRGKFVYELNSMSDEDLLRLAKQSRAVLFPSFVEGYGMPLAEMLSVGVPVIASDIEVFREIGQGVPEFASPKDAEIWMKLVKEYCNKESALRREQIKRIGKWNAYSWEKHFEKINILVVRTIEVSKKTSV